MTKQSRTTVDSSNEAPNAGVNPWLNPNLDSVFFENAEVRQLREKATEYARAGAPILISGQAGLGKTSLALEVAKSLDRPVSFMTGNAWLDASDFIGGAIGSTSSSVVDKYIQSVRRTETQTRTDWQGSVLVGAMERGHTLIYDEFTRATPEANATLLSVLEEGVLVCTDPAGPQTHVRAHPDFRILLTSNPHDYVAVNSAPDALLDRVVILPMPEYSAETIARIVETRVGLTPSHAARLVDILGQLRLASQEHRFSMLRCAILIGRIAAFRARSGPLLDEEILELARDILAGRGILIGPETAGAQFKKTKAA